MKENLAPENQDETSIQSTEFQQEVDSDKELNDELKQKCDELEGKVKDLEEQVKRSMADYQNLLRRSQQEREQMHKYAVEPAITAIIPCLDNFYFALKSFDEGSSTEQLLQSLKMLWSNLISSLSQVGVSIIDSREEPFDPNRQEAVSQIVNDELPEGTIVEVSRIGYSLNDKVIRPSQVSVSVKSK